MSAIICQLEALMFLLFVLSGFDRKVLQHVHILRVRMNKK